MKFSKKTSLVLILLICISLIVSACSSTNEATSNSSSGSKSGEKINLTLMIAWPDDVNGKREEELVTKKFANKYDITFKPVDGNVLKTVKTSIAAGEPVDLSFYWTSGMGDFTEGDMALDLTPYLKANNNEWMNTFIDGSLDLATIKGKIYAVPQTPVYPMMIANKDLLDQAGVTIPDQPTWDEFTSAMTKVKEKLGITPLGMQSDWAGWLVRNNLRAVWPNDSKVKEWSEGKISFNDPEVVKVFDATKRLYDKGYVYPGEGALTMTGDQVLNAFKSKKIAFMGYINYLAGTAIKNSGVKNAQILTFPHMGPRSKVMGTANGFMIPANAKHPEASIEILKYLTSKEVLQKRVDNGSPVSIKDVKSDDPKIALYARDAGNLYTEKEITSISPQMNDYIGNKIPANYIFNPKTTLKDLEKLRLDAIKQKK
ncbi:extracellular solute-binding protein [Neobacillus drentensis]|uniref:ABC transporter substrate-binding protein n=1 Tax=Neobacillus drentensis TaxID=220684 RepID=UPI001F1CAD91|nr:extracellular solute-binding protein [Neobacillus drentensis]ULT54895.1 extracellular solute-binding protein [Neobacillus drentensis]